MFMHPKEAIALLRPVDDGSEYSYELTLENVVMENRTKRQKA